MNYTLDDLPAGHWNDEQAIEAMRRVAIEAAEGWGGSLFLTIEEALAPDASAELHGWALKVAGTMMLNLITQTEEVAASLGFSPDQSRRFVEDRVGACRSRLVKLASTFASRGTA